VASVESGIVQFEQVAFRYRRRAPWVLRDVTLTVPRGRVIEVNGANGTGKSTLLRLLAGVVPPVRGRVSGRPARVGYAPERFPTAQPFTARAYLDHMARVRGVPPDHAGEWAERLGLAGLLDTRLADLSKGSAHKTGLVQALIASPDLTVPMIEWMRAAGHGPSDFTDVFPAMALRTVAWTAVAGALYA
jgi:ABC-type multidrug transport system ATPase subunit